MIFLKKKMELTVFSFVLSVFILFGGVLLVRYAGFSQIVVYLGAAVFLVVMEWIITIRIVRRKGLVVRRGA